MTRLGGVPVAAFEVRATTLAYRALPIRDELVPVGGDRWHGVGRIAGVPFCRFRLVRRAPAGSGSRSSS